MDSFSKLGIHSENKREMKNKKIGWNPLGKSTHKKPSVQHTGYFRHIGTAENIEIS